MDSTLMENPEHTTPVLNLNDLTGNTARQMISAARTSVYQEIFRAQNIDPALGGSTHETIQRQINHTETVVNFCTIEVGILQRHGVEITQAEENYSIILALLHDATKIAPERTPSDRLLLHGWDSANWALNWLHLQGASTELILQTQSDLQSHMGAPFIENVLSNATNTDLIPKWDLPHTTAAAILLTADLLSPMVLAGPDPSHPDAGSFDRYFYLNGALPYIQSEPNPAQAAFLLAKDSLEKNVLRLANPPEPNSPGRQKAASIERILANSLGQKALAKISSLELHITDQIGWQTLCNRFPDGQMDQEATQKAYYDAVFSWKETNPLQLDFTYLENQ